MLRMSLHWLMQAHPSCPYKKLRDTCFWEPFAGAQESQSRHHRYSPPQLQPWRMSFKANPFTQYICASVTVQKRIGPKGKTDAEVEDSMTIPLSLSTLILKTSTVLLSFLQQILIFRLHLHDLVICARRLHAQDECKLTWVSMAQLLICQSVKVKIKIQINYYNKKIYYFPPAQVHPCCWIPSLSHHPCPSSAHSFCRPLAS